jgi:hypothetical protein
MTVNRTGEGPQIPPSTAKLIQFGESVGKATSVGNREITPPKRLFAPQAQPKNALQKTKNIGLNPVRGYTKALQERGIPTACGLTYKGEWSNRSATVHSRSKK